MIGSVRMAVKNPSGGPPGRMKVAFLTIDAREHLKDYDTPEPYFGTAPAGLLDGFDGMPGVEVHVISCASARMRVPEMIGSNI